MGLDAFDILSSGKNKNVVFKTTQIALFEVNSHLGYDALHLLLLLGSFDQTENPKKYLETWDHWKILSREDSSKHLALITKNKVWIIQPLASDDVL